MAKKKTEKPEIAVEIKEVMEDKTPVEKDVVEATASEDTNKAESSEVEQENKDCNVEESCDNSKDSENEDSDECECDGDCEMCEAIGQHILERHKAELRDKGRVLTRIAYIEETHKIRIGIEPFRENRTEVYPYGSNKHKRDRCLTREEMDMIIEEVVPPDAEIIRIEQVGSKFIDIKYVIHVESPFGTMKQLKKHLKKMHAPSVMSITLDTDDDKDDTEESKED